MDQYNVAKALTDKTLQALEAHILSIRQRSQQLMERHSDLLDRQLDLQDKHGGSSIKGTDNIHLNVGGTEMYVLRDTLTQIKGSRLEVLFSGRWEDKLLRDEKGRVFMDLDARYFKKIVEYLHLLKADGEINQGTRPDWPKLSNRNEQKVLELYIDFFRLNTADKGDCTSSSTVKPVKTNDERTESYDDLLDVVKNEAQELEKVEKNLDKMQKKLDEEEEFVSFFTTTQAREQKQGQGEGQGLREG